MLTLFYSFELQTSYLISYNAEIAVILYFSLLKYFNANVLDSITFTLITFQNQVDAFSCQRFTLTF